MRTKDYYTDLLTTYSPLSIWSSKIKEATEFALLYRDRYKKVKIVPWQVVAAIHLRENRSWSAGLHNGERWDTITIKVPKNVGPFSSWEEAARDALLREKHLFPTTNLSNNWTLEEMAHFLEGYNGWGYSMYHDKDSPYLWSASNHGIETGKYKSDGQYDKRLVDEQVGALVLVLALKHNKMADNWQYLTDKGLEHSKDAILAKLEKNYIPDNEPITEKDLEDIKNYTTSTTLVTKEKPILHYNSKKPDAIEVEYNKAYQRFLNGFSDVHFGTGYSFNLKQDGWLGKKTALAHYIIFRTKLEGDPLS